MLESSTEEPEPSVVGDATLCADSSSSQYRELGTVR